MTPLPINFKGLIADFFSNAITLELPLLRTLRELVLRPGHFIRGYIEGKRKYIYRPVQFYLLALTAYYLVLFYLVGDDFFLNQDLQGGDSPLNADQLDKLRKVGRTFTGYSRFLMAAQIPLHAFYAWLLFRKHKHNYWIYITASLFISGTMLLLNALTQAIGTFSPSWLQTMLGFGTGIGALVYNIWVYRQFLQEKTSVVAIKVIALVVLNLITFTIITALVVFVLLKLKIVSF